MTIPPLHQADTPPRCTWYRMVGLSIGLFWLLPQQPIVADPVEIRVDLNQVVTSDFWGVGVEWSAYPWWDLSDADWETVFRRVEFLRMPVTRIMQDAFYYCKGFDASGEPVYDFQSPLVTKLYRLLDWCEANNCRVIFGEWGHPQGRNGLTLANDDPRWPRLFVDFLEELVKRRGYECVAVVNLINEPHGWWARVPGGFAEWSRTMHNLADELNRRGLAERLPLCMPDGEWLWTTKVLQDDTLREQAGVYDEHWYVTAEQVRRGLVELRARDQRRQIDRRDPSKPYVISELGLVDGKTGDDKQPNVHEYWYGVAMADAAIQLMRGGVSAVVAWDLDDAMHFVGDGDVMANMDDLVPDDAYERRKVWGMWNSLGAEHGDPSDEQLRPWFAAWSMLTRFFPAGCEIVQCDTASVYEVRVVAARVDNRAGLTVAVVCNGDKSEEIHVTIPAIDVPMTFNVHEYFDKDGDNRVDSWQETTDREGRDIFPSASRQLTIASGEQGLTAKMKGRGLVVFTTLDAVSSTPQE